MSKDTTIIPPPKPRLFYGYVVVAASFVILVLIVGMYYSFGVFFKPMSTDFGWSRALTSGAFSVSWIVGGPLSIAIGGLNDRIGPRIILTVCSVCSGLGYLLMSQITDVWQLYLFYGLLIGIGGSVFVPSVSTTAKWFVQRRTVMTGVVISGVGAGVLIGPLVAAQLIQSYGWRTAFIIIGVTVLIIATIASQFLRKEPGQVGQQPYGSDRAINENASQKTTSFSLKEALRTWQFWVLFTMLVCYGYYLLTIQIHLVPYLTDLGISATMAASLVALPGGSSFIGRIALGILGDRIGNKKAFIIGFILSLLCLVWLLFTREVWGFYLFAIIFGIAYGDCAVQQTPLTAAMFGLRSLGLIFGCIGLGFTIGAAIGPLVSGYIFDATRSYFWAFIVCIIVCAISLILNIILTPPKARPSDKR